jgi:hypothetical protein
LVASVYCLCGAWPPLLQAQDCPAGSHLPASPGATSACHCARCTAGRHDHDADAATPCRACPAGRLSEPGALACGVPCGPGSRQTGAPWAEPNRHHPCDGSVLQVDAGERIEWATAGGQDCAWLIACAPGAASRGRRRHQTPLHATTSQ